MLNVLPNSSRPLQFYVIAKRWASDLEFFKLESNFLQQLLERYVHRLQDEPQLGQLIKANRDLQELEKMVDTELLDRQLTQLELMAEDVIPEDTDALTEEQVKLENLMACLTAKFREVKQEVYTLVLQAPPVELPLKNNY